LFIKGFFLLVLSKTQQIFNGKKTEMGKFRLIRGLGIRYGEQNKEEEKNKQH